MSNGDMTFREQNMVKWVGCRPAHNGDQVLENCSVVDGTDTIYTVPADKIFYLCNVNVMQRNNSTGLVEVDLYDDVPALVCRLVMCRSQIDRARLSDSRSFWPPMEIPEGYAIKGVSSNAAVRCDGSIFGWVEDA